MVWTVVFIIIAAFGIYWTSSFLLQAGGATTRFGADSFLYSGLADGNVPNRTMRFHPLTVVLALVWMKVLAPLTLWIEPLQLLKAMFAAVGAAGVAAAIWAFAAVVPQRYSLTCALIYGSTLGVWYFASIEESKIVTATLSVLYIAIYLHLRDNWTRRGASLLTAVLLLVCLNEIVAGFLVMIPVADTLVRRGFDWRHGWWIVVHAMAGPLALFILEIVVNGLLVPRDVHPESASEFSHLLYWISLIDYNGPLLYSFAVKWLFFNIAAPSTIASYAADPTIKYGGDFEPVLRHYLATPLPAAITVLFAVMVVAIALPRYRPTVTRHLAGALCGIAAYALVRGLFFMIYLPGEPLINSPAVGLAHLMLVIIPFAASRFPAKHPILLLFAVVLFLDNGLFIVSQR